MKGGFIHMLVVVCLTVNIVVLVNGESQQGDQCNRACEVNRPMTCEFHFRVENYFILSRACHLCPFVRSDCFRPHCIQTNGLARSLLTVNRQMPGPSIEVCEGDTVKVTVENHIDDGQSTSIHMHGLHQRYTNFMDGVGRLTQCNIGPGETFEYKFTADNAGTHWWHSHTGVQLGNGVMGPFIVREPATRDPHYSLYDEDLSEHVMFVSEWIDTSPIDRYMEEMQDRWRMPIPLNVLVNGRGAYHYVQPDRNLLGLADNEPTPEPMQTPYHVFYVTQGKRYRFRLIGAAMRCYFQVMLDEHQMTVITTDGVPIQPATVGSLILHPGERYDVVVDANAPLGDYWLNIEGLGDCAGGGNGAAIFHYDGYQGDDAFLPQVDPYNFTRTDTLFCPATEQLEAGIETERPVMHQSQLRYDTVVDEVYDDEEVNIQYYIGLKYQANDNSMYSHPEYYPTSSRYGLITPTLNNITMFGHGLPLVTQWDDIEDKRFCNSWTLDTVNDCNHDLCHCVHMLDIPYGKTVELFISSQANDPHQMHLHGYSFRVVGDGYVSDEYSSEAMTAQEVMDHDKTVGYPRILTNPMYKDTITVHGKGGYSIIRFKADNPGIWFFHCHNEGHLMQGMAMVMKVGEPQDFPVPPDSFPVCGQTKKMTHNPDGCSTSNAGRTYGVVLGTLLLPILATLSLIL